MIPAMRMKPASLPAGKSERGQSLTELAISFPLILLLLLGTLDFGMALYSYVIVRDAAQEGALYGSFNPNNNVEIESRARHIAPMDSDALFFFPVDLDNKDVVEIRISTSGDNCQGRTSGVTNNITVTASYSYKLIMPFAEQLIGSETI